MQANIINSNSECFSSSQKMHTDDEARSSSSSIKKSYEESNLSSYSANALTTSEEIIAQKFVLENPSNNSIDSIMFSSLNSEKNDENQYYPFERSCTLFKSIASLAPDVDPLHASSIGVKCINSKPVGYIFLTRRLLDVYMTDGQRKVEIVYNYSKKFKKRKMKIPSKSKGNFFII